MSHGPEHHLEHAEHGSHAIGPFDRKVAMTMAITAAGLACVAMLGHRGHTETLRLQSEANNFLIEASDAWNLYQAKNIRSHEFQSFLMAEMLRDKSGSPSQVAERIRGYWIGQVDKYEGKGFWEELAKYLEGTKTEQEEKAERPKRRDDSELKKLEHDAREFQSKAKERRDASIHVHHAVNWLDLGHLAFEFALVLASVAVLTKQRGFWMVAIVVAILGALVALYAVYGLYLAPHH